MKTELLKKILINRRQSINASRKVREALELYSDSYVSFSDQYLTQIVRDILQQEYGDGVIIIYEYLLYGIHHVIDRDQVEVDNEGNKILRGGGKNNPDKVKEIITDDDRFISYFLESYEQ